MTQIGCNSFHVNSLYFIQRNLCTERGCRTKKFGSTIVYTYTVSFPEYKTKNGDVIKFILAFLCSHEVNLKYSSC